MVKTMVKQIVPLQPVEDNIGTDIRTATCGGPHAAAAGGDALNEAADCVQPT